MCAKVRVPGGAAIHKKVFTSQKGLCSTGGSDLLKWGLPGGGVKSAKVAPTPYVYLPPVDGDPRSAESCFDFIFPAREIPLYALYLSPLSVSSVVRVS